MFQRVKVALDIAMTLVVIAAGTTLLWKLYSAQRPPTQGGRAPVESVSERLVLRDGSHVRGGGDIALVEFSDYECPFCGQYAATTDPVLKREFIDKKVVRHIAYNFPLSMHPHAAKAAEAAECAAAQGKFWEMREWLFAHQSALTLDDLRAHAKSLSLDAGRFDRCLDSGDASKGIERDVQEGKRLGISGTPIFFMGRVNHDGSIALLKRINASAPADQFASVIRDLAPSLQATRR